MLKKTKLWFALKYLVVFKCPKKSHGLTVAIRPNMLGVNTLQLLIFSIHPPVHLYPTENPVPILLTSALQFHSLVLYYVYVFFFPHLQSQKETVKENWERQEGRWKRAEEEKRCSLKIVNSSCCQAPGWATHSLSLYLIDTQTHAHMHTHKHTHNTLPLCPDLLVQTIPGTEKRETDVEIE